MNLPIFTPVFMSEKEFEEAYKHTEFYTDKNFRDVFYKYQSALMHVSACAKIYILNNWGKVKDWTNLDIMIVDGRDGEETHYYKFIESEEKDRNRTMKQYMELLREGHNPIISFDEVILDPSDGDFSVKINGKDHYWIDDDAVIAIANYIETYEEPSDTPPQG